MNDILDIGWLSQAAMRDGVRLGYRLYRPQGAGPLPVLLTMTPYGMDTQHPTAARLARAGFAVAVADCRGRGESEGDFVPSFCDAKDGHDMVEWLAAQSFCDGRVAMWGGSYAGENQWNTLAARPPHLVAIAPAAAAHMPADYPWRGPVRMPYMLLWFMLVSGRSAALNLFADAPVWLPALASHYRSGAAFRDLPRSMGKGSRHFDAHVAHPAHDPFWQQLAFSPSTYGAFDIPILSINGQFDDGQRGALHILQQHEKHGSPEGIARHFAIIGPWDHGGTRSGVPETGGAHFGEAGRVDLTALMIGFFDWVLRGGPRPMQLTERLTFYVTGAKEWRHTMAMSALGQSLWHLHPAPAGALLETPPEVAGSDAWLSDPADIRMADIEALPLTEALTDDRAERHLLGAGMTYLSAAVETERTLAGRPVLQLWVETDLPDADLQATLWELAPDGSKLKLSEDFFRLRYRQGPDQEALCQEGEVFPVTFDAFTFVARRIAKGARLRLTVRTVNSIHKQRNFQGGGNVDRETLTDARVGWVRLWHGPGRCARLDLPLLADERRK